MKRVLGIILFAALLTFVVPQSHAQQLSCSDRSEIGFGITEIRGHIWAIEANLDDAIEPYFEHDIDYSVPQHGGHPVFEVMPELAELDAYEDLESLHSDLKTLRERTLDPSAMAELESAISAAKSNIDRTETMLLGSPQSDPGLYASIIASLVTLSADEYKEAIVYDEQAGSGAVDLAVELQDAYAFIALAQQTFERISSGYDSSFNQEINDALVDIDAIYDNRGDPRQVSGIASLVSDRFEYAPSTPGASECDYFDGDSEMRELTDAEMERAMGHLANVRSLLLEAQSVYAADPAMAEALVTDAYLNHFEFIEDDIKATGNEELNEKVEHAIREDLRAAIRDQDPNVSQMIDDILVDLNLVEQVIPEFGPLALVVLAATVAAVVVVSARSGLFASMRQV